MHRASLLAALVLIIIAAVAGGATLRLVGLAGSPEAVVTILGLAVLLVATVFVVSRSRSRLSTPYW